MLLTGLRDVRGKNIDLTFVQEQLQTLRSLDPDFRVFGAGVHQYRLRAPLPAKVVHEFELRHSIHLPTSYCEMVTGLSNGGAGPNYGLVEFERAGAGNTPSQPFPSPVISNSGQIAEFDYGSVPGVIWLSDNGCATFDVLVVNGESYGCVWTILDERDYYRCQDFESWYCGWLSSAINTIRREPLLKLMSVGMHLDDVRGIFGPEIVPVDRALKQHGFSLCFHDCNAHFTFDGTERLTRFDHQSHLICPRI